jgi:hypothetical protein
MLCGSISRRPVVRLIQITVERHNIETQMPPRISAICCLLLQTLWYKIPQGSEKILGRCNSRSGKQFQIGKGNIESNSLWAIKICTTSGTVDRTLGCRRGNCRFQPGFHLLMPDHSRLLRHEAPAAEDDEVWNASHVEPARYFRIAFSVKLYYDSSSSHIRRRTRNFRSRHPARSAPRSPEIHKHRNMGILNDFREGLRINFQRFVHRLQRSLAGATPSGIGEMCRRNTVHASTSFAGSNYWHTHRMLARHVSLAWEPVRDNLPTRCYCNAQGLPIPLKSYNNVSLVMQYDGRKRIPANVAAISDFGPAV